MVEWVVIEIVLFVGSYVASRESLLIYGHAAVPFEFIITWLAIEIKQAIRMDDAW